MVKSRSTRTPLLISIHLELLLRVAGRCHSGRAVHRPRKLPALADATAASAAAASTAAEAAAAALSGDFPVSLTQQRIGRRQL